MVKSGWVADNLNEDLVGGCTIPSATLVFILVTEVDSPEWLFQHQ